MTFAWCSVWFVLAAVAICVAGAFRRINVLEGKVRRLQEVWDRMGVDPSERGATE